jgi:channel protein (hemolysin III family)
MDDIDVFSIPGIREPFNCLTHLIAACVFSVLGYFLVRKGRGSWIRTASLAVMVITSVFMLSMSGVFHLLGPGNGRHVMRQLDIAGVFALIAGTMTPIHAILFRGFGRWSSLSLLWTAAALGITLRTIFEARLPFAFGTGIFLVLGWGGLIVGILLWRRYGYSFVKPLVWGGVAYTLGAIFLSLNWPTLIPGVVGAHEVWHLAVLTGLGLHWKFVFQFADGPHRTQCDQGTTKTLTINAKRTASC